MLYAIAALLVLIADQALKYYVTLHIPLDEGVVTLIPGFMSLTHYHNTGAAFSMLSGGGARWAFVVLAIAVTAATIYLLLNRRIQSKAICWSLVFVCAGAIGNAIDRAFYGYVVDMFRTDFMTFAIFNVADIFITCGGFALCLAILMMPSDKPEKAAYAEDDETGIASGDAPVIKQEKNPGIKLFSEKPKLPDEIAERRRTGKLYGEKKPIDAADPFAEFAKMPTSFDPPKKAAAQPAAPESDHADELASKLRRELDLDAIVREFSDGDL